MQGSDKTYRDILGQASTLPLTLDTLEETALPSFALEPGRGFVFTGCGASYHAAQCAALLLRALGDVPAQAVPGSELWLLPKMWLKDNPVVVSISRTGTTTEVLRAMERAREFGSPTIAISLARDVPMYDLADFRMELSHVREEGRVMTQSFSNMLLAAQWLVTRVVEAVGSAEGELYKRALGDAVQTVGDCVSQFDSIACEIARPDAGEYVFVGSGPLSGICAQAVLQMKEMTQVPSAAYAGLEYRHGPIATLTDRSVVAFASCPRTAVFDSLIAEDVGLLGGTAVMAAPELEFETMPDGVRAVALPNGLADWLYGNVALPFFQLLAYHQTVKLGKDPESVHNLDRNVEPHVNPHVLELPLAVAG